MTTTIVTNGETLNNPTMVSGDVIDVNSGGFLTNCAVPSGATVNLNGGAHAIDIILNNGAHMSIAQHGNIAVNNTVFHVGGTLQLTDLTFVSATPGSGTVGGGDPFVWTLNNVQGTIDFQMSLRIPTGSGNEFYDTAEFVASQVNGTAVRRTA